MTLKEQQNLKLFYDAVFDKDGKIKSCGREVCSRLIRLMRRYTSRDIGNESTGIMNVDVLKSEYYRIIVC